MTQPNVRPQYNYKQYLERLLARIKARCKHQAMYVRAGIECHITQKDIDLILVEGFKNEKIPKIQLYRSDLLSACVVMNDPELLAIAADIPLDLLTSPVKLDINKPQQIAEFIVSWLHTVNINKLSTFSDKADAF